MLALEPARVSVVVSEDYLDDIALAFGEVVDAKSPFTSGHSSRVAHYAVSVARELDPIGVDLRSLRRAALLHDVGKLAVPNTILDKPGSLGEDEWVTMRDHAIQSEAILSRISALSRMAFIAGAHHERLDGQWATRVGSRAPRSRLKPRIITVADFFDALCADGRIAPPCRSTRRSTSFAAKSAARWTRPASRRCRRWRCATASEAALDGFDIEAIAALA